MRISAQRLNQIVEEQLFAILFQVLDDARSSEEVEILLRDLLGEIELKVVAKRLAIAIYLDKGRSYENIRQVLKVSSATIASVQEKIGNPGMQLALSKIKADEWAGGWTDKLVGILRQLKK